VELVLLQVKVYRKPIVALMSTGNEIVDLQRPRDKSGEPGKDGWAGTFDTNRPSLTAALQGMGYEVIDHGIASDELRTIFFTRYHCTGVISRSHHVASERTLKP
jgi:molybdopterin biosynthesis enzyme